MDKSSNIFPKSAPMASLPSLRRTSCFGAYAGRRVKPPEVLLNIASLYYRSELWPALASAVLNATGSNADQSMDVCCQQTAVRDAGVGRWQAERHSARSCRRRSDVVQFDWMNREVFCRDNEIQRVPFTLCAAADVLSQDALGPKCLSVGVYPRVSDKLP